MRALACQIATAVVEAYGPYELIRRVSDPYWFQALGCVLGFDWHSSGLTTTVCAALKEGLKSRSRSLGVYVAGGKGGTSRKTPDEIQGVGRVVSTVPVEPLVTTSRRVAKVDSACVQDGYTLYHHTIFFTEDGTWSVVQQGMNEQDRTARRYHWHGNVRQGPLPYGSFVNEPHTAVCCDRRKERVLNLVAEESAQARAGIVQAVREYGKTLYTLRHLRLPHRHEILWEDLDHKRLEAVLHRADALWPDGPERFEQILDIPGLGPKGLRALSLVAEVVYGTEASFRDPARFAYAHGGKDGHPFPVDRALYDRSIQVLKDAILKARLGRRDRLDALRNLACFDKEVT